MNIGIIGQGFVGNAVFQKFKSFFKVYTYDVISELCNSSFGDILKNCNIIFVCLPTPMNNDGSCNVEIVREVLSRLNNETKAVIVNKSTIPPGTTEEFQKQFKNLKIIFNPEFLTERNAIEDFNNQDRIILGGPRPATTELKQIYSTVFPNSYVIKTGSKHAEMIKYFTNCFLANKVSFANEMHDLCSALDLDYDKVVEYATLDKRLGKSHWAVPGPDADFGFGGHCFPKDLSAIINMTEKLGVINNVLKATKQTNDKLRKNRDWENMKGRAIN
ncbi:nucleotide sugar dehydrogenase [Flavobacteriaceae bacterium]|nr:nucleotide sugar dehydrogenase [Flavobacteriaceae bacterium]